MAERYTMDDNGEAHVCSDLLTWARWMENADRHICKTETENGVTISTVFLGLNHSFYDVGQLLFETMIFGGDHDQYQERYATKQEAIEGHMWAVKLVAGLEEAK